ncbi:hypothetical protein RMR16_025320 (plasmid) [Agrobacterium sp. rho-13.3]|uniref:hypothetical protein n=1 Tax=Agrobacterium sp. rho-13.3 TaxID=3072980 RepID=UPI002A1545D2|nr:hypothetical protein [Agrobacterium sp. rho-13.3]MDX8310270.1 hypothetical protein [Agrobacterium sp. rho-13.3]
MNANSEVSKLTKLAKKDCLNWNVDPLNIKLHLNQPKEKLEQYADGQADFSLVALKTNSLLVWHFARYRASLLSGARDIENLVFASKYAVWSFLMDEPPATVGRAGPFLMDQAAFLLGLQIICGWKRRALAVGDALVKGLDTPLLDLRNNERHNAGSLYPHFWFLIQMFRAGKGEPFIDLTPYSHPERMAPYDQVLTDWKTTDLSKVKRWVEDMAEHHIQSTDDSDPDALNEFDNPKFKLFPYEILAFLRIREWAGLSNPLEFDHPLMNQSLAYKPLLAELPLPDPETPLLDRVLVRYQRDWPDLRIPDGL